MKKILFSLIFASVSLVQAQTTPSANINLAKAVELGCHRIERLVTLKKIDESFLRNIGTMSATAMTAAQPTDPSFKVVASQYPGSDGSSAQLEMLMDSQGKTLSFNVIAGSAAANPPVWPDKDSVTLVENSLHYVLDGWQGVDPNVEPFYTGLKSLRISQVKDSSGQSLSKTEFLSNTVGTTLSVYLKMDGTLSSTEIK